MEDEKLTATAVSGTSLFEQDNSQFQLKLKYDSQYSQRGLRQSLTGNTFGSGVSGPRIIKSLYGGNSSGSFLVLVHSKVHIGLLGCIIVIVGCVLGSGIFAAPQEILNLTENSALTLLVWFTYGIVALLAALCYVELGTTIPVSGGDYAYLNECFGSLPAFLFQWSANFIVIPVCCAIMAIVVAKNLVNPYLDLENPDENLSARWASCLLAIVFIMLFCYINCVSSKLTEKIQGWLMIVNLITISLICGCGITYMIVNGIHKDADLNLKLPVPPQTITSRAEIIKFQILQTVKALHQASFSYFGYTYVTYITEELENPNRNLPLGICISIPLIIVVNVFVNFCYIASLPKTQIMHTQTIASDMFRAVLPTVALPYLSWLAPTLVAIAVSGGLTSTILACSRIAFIGARNGHFPRIFGMVHVHNVTPVVSIAWMGLLGSLYVLVGNAGGIPILIAIATYLYSTFNCLCIYGLIYLRIKKPDIHRPIKLPLILPIAYAIVATFLFLIPIITMDKNTVKTTLPGVSGAIFVVFTGIPVFYLFIYKDRNWTCLNTIHSNVMILLQKLWMVLPEDRLYENET